MRKTLGVNIDIQAETSTSSGKEDFVSLLEGILINKKLKEIQTKETLEKLIKLKAQPDASWDDVCMALQDHEMERNDLQKEYIQKLKEFR